METAQELVDLLRVLGDGTRLRLMLALNDGELTVGEITQVTGLSQPRVSRHLKLLCEARVLDRTRDQNEVYYRATVEEDRRALVQTALRALPQEDPHVGQDRDRLRTILDRRQSRATELLARLGVCPLGPEALAEVSAAIDSLLSQHLGSAPLGDLLDVGTGTGSMLRLLAGRARRAVAVEISREMRLVARTAVLAGGLSNCTVRAGDMYALSFATDEFDIVTMDRVLGAAEEPVKALEEVSRVLKPRGHLLVVEASESTVNELELGRWIRRVGLAPVETRQAGRNVALVALSRRPANDHTKVE